MGIEGSGVVCLESDCPKEELIEITLEDDVLKIDGNMAIAWSGSLEFKVERSGKTLGWFSRFRRRISECLSWNRKNMDCAY